MTNPDTKTNNSLTVACLYSFNISLCNYSTDDCRYAERQSANYYVNRRKIIKWQKKIFRIMWRTLSINGKKNYVTVCERDKYIANNNINLIITVLRVTFNRHMIIIVNKLRKKLKII